MELGTTLKLMSPKVAGGVLEVRTKLTLAVSATATAARETVARAQGRTPAESGKERLYRISSGTPRSSDLVPHARKPRPHSMATFNVTPATRQMEYELPRDAQLLNRTDGRMPGVPCGWWTGRMRGICYGYEFEELRWTG